MSDSQIRKYIPTYPEIQNQSYPSIFQPRKISMFEIYIHVLQNFPPRGNNECCQNKTSSSSSNIYLRKQVKGFLLCIHVVTTLWSGVRIEQKTSLVICRGRYRMPILAENVNVACGEKKLAIS